MNRVNTRSIGESSSDLNLVVVRSTLIIGIDYLQLKCSTALVKSR
jgi:hypothetical protein